MANNRFIRLISFFVALWYIISVTGFNMHICSHTGEVSFSISSENVHCSHHSHENEEICICGEHHYHPEHGPAFTDASCCSDHSLHIDATSLLDDSERHIFSQLDFVAICPFVLLDANEDLYATHKKHLNTDLTRAKKSGDILPLCSVWRI